MSNMRPTKITPRITPKSSQVLKMYFQEVNKYPLLTMEEEVELAQRIREGDKEALNRMVNCNLRLVISVANQYLGRGLDHMDLINEGNIGLMNATRHFDETMGFKFNTYAIAWIRQAIMSALSKHGRMVRLPQNKIEDYLRVQNFVSMFEQKHESTPAIAEIAEGLKMAPSKVSTLLKMYTKEVSMDMPLKDGEDFTLIDITPNEDAPGAEDWVESCSLREELSRALSSLSDKEREIVRLYYGIGCSALNLEKIGEKVHLSLERVRQIKRDALRTLRSSPNSGLLRSYL